MTREEAKEKITKSMECHDRKVCGLAETCEECPLYVDKDTEYEAHKILISALEQQSCEDAVNRDEAITAVRRAFSWVVQSNPSKEVREIFNKCKENLRELPPVTQKPGKCKNCKYFEYDSVAKVDGVPLIVAHEICNKWGNGCKTSEDGYCYLFEPQESE